MLVYVQDIDGNPLMPTSRYGWVRRSLRDGKAIVVERCPFVIRLTYNSNRYVQNMTLGLDPGVNHIGISVTTVRDELYASQIDLRYNIVELLKERSFSRRSRRLRLRYREERYHNRRLGEGWLSPSVCHKINSHFRFIDDVYMILPIYSMVVETSKFDIHKIKNPNISGCDYQYGEKFGFWNVREYVLYRDGHRCRYCGGKSKDKILNVHHLESRRVGGDSPGNLITLCRTCHNLFHMGEIKLNIDRSKPLRGAAVMNTMRWSLYNGLKMRYKNVKMTFGYITKKNRIDCGLKKNHTSDAFVISQNITAKRLGYYYKINQVRRHNRKLHRFKIQKGGIKRKDKTSFEVKGFRLFDRVKRDGNVMFICGRRDYGKMRICDIDFKNGRDSSFRKLILDRVKRHMIDIKKNEYGVL